MTTDRETFTCGQCEALSQQRSTPPGTAHPDCARCGEPTKQYVGAVIAGRAVLLTATEYMNQRIYGERIPDSPGVRVVGGVELYSAGWL